MGEINHTRAAPTEVGTDAYLKGRRAGREGQLPSANPHLPGSADHTAWEQGRHSIVLDQVGYEIDITIKPCMRANVPVACWCGGRGLCLDVA